MSEEKQGAAEWLRGIADKYDAEGGVGCREVAELFGFCCDGVDTCQECRTKELRVIADRIESERALPEGIEWPRFEDGKPVSLGDEVECQAFGWSVVAFAFGDKGWSMTLARDLDVSQLHGAYGERVKRYELPKPVLDADGAPIEVGDTVWTTYGYSHQRVVSAVFANGSEEYGIPYGIPAVRYASGGWDRANSVTHERPDSWERLEEDAYHLVMSEYLETPEEDVRDIVRRAKALAKAGE